MISIENLCKRYNRVDAVRDLNLDVRAGTVFGFVGENGAGKTTTLSILATLMLPTSGRAYIGGHEVTTDPAEVRRLIGYMPDSFGVYEDLTVREYLAFYGTAYGVAAPVIERRTRELLQVTNLGDRVDEDVGHLSRGMQQRLGVARCLMHDPPVLILDEPASGLDPRSRIEMRELVKNLRERGKTILISSHILPELAEMCDEIGVIQHGTLVACAAVEVVTARASGQRQLAFDVLRGGRLLARVLQEHASVTELLTVEDERVDVLFSGDEAQQAELLRDLIVAGYPVVAAREIGGSLEDLFLRLTEDGALSSGERGAGERKTAGTA